MKTIILTAAVLLGLNSKAQWEAESYQDDFSEEQTKFIYVQSGTDALGYYVEEDSYLILGDYFCDEDPTIYIAVYDSIGGKEIIKVIGSKIKSGQMFFRLSQEETNSLRNGVNMKIKISESYCDNEYFEFTLEGFKEAENQLK
jgi:hypothetical protein